MIITLIQSNWRVSIIANCRIVVDYEAKDTGGYGINVTIQGDGGCVPMGMLEDIRDKIKRGLTDYRFHGQKSDPIGTTIGVTDGRTRRTAKSAS